MSVKAAQAPDRARIEEIASAVVESALRVHTELGPGLLESSYEVALAFELRERGFKVDPQVPLPVMYRGHRLDANYRIDLVIEDCVLIEIKSVEAIAPIHKAQVITYLKLSGIKLGLLLNFNVVHMRNGMQRVVNGL